MIPLRHFYPLDDTSLFLRSPPRGARGLGGGPVNFSARLIPLITPARSLKHNKNDAVHWNADISSPNERIKEMQTNVFALQVGRYVLTTRDLRAA